MPCYAKDKVQKLEYIELWYFTLEGRNNNFQMFTTSLKEGFGLAQAGSNLVLRPAAVLTPSKKALADKDLSWFQFTISYPVLISTMWHVPIWTKKYCDAL